MLMIKLYSKPNMIDRLLGVAALPVSY